VVKPVYDIKIKTQVALGRGFTRNLPHYIEEYIMAQTQKQRMALIRKVSKKFNKKLQRNQSVRKTETSFLDKVDNGDNIYAYTDAPKYVNEYYGDRARDQESYERDWD
jgi:gamma-glutamyltranspeptidase